MTGPPAARHLSPWGMLVLVSAIVVLGAAAALLVATVASSHERQVRFAVRGSLNGVSLDVGDGDVEIVGGGARPLLRVQRTDHYAFSHDAEVSRSVAGGELRIRARCPSSVPMSCSLSYRLTVPDNVPITVRTDGGTVRLRGYRGSARLTTNSGAIDVTSFCGFSLQARAESGDIVAASSCAPQLLSLRSTSGDVEATVPPGRYQVDAESAAGSRQVSGLAAAADAPYSIQALSSSGDVTVEGQR